MSTAEKYFSLLERLADGCLKYQLRSTGDAALDGALLCPACGVIHGRCHEAAYPLLCLARTTGKEKYLDAAKRLFAWGGNMVCEDGSVLNDGQSEWRGITVFSAVSMLHALTHHGPLLSPSEKAQWEERLSKQLTWIKNSIDPDIRPFNINYICSGAAALALGAAHFGSPEMKSAAYRLSRYALARMDADGLIYGEGTPNDLVTPGGARPVDMGYLAEESLPSLYEYAVAAKDEEALRVAKRCARAVLAFMLPDGAWDNSFGTRNFKWTYWGSRTADGCQALFNALGKADPVFSEAALRNLALYERCLDKYGLLAGGPDYAARGERACIHHSFCRMKVLAQVLDEGVCEAPGAALPSEEATGPKRYASLGMRRLSAPGWLADITDGDFEYMKGGHASGGALTLLFNRLWGPAVAAANTVYSLKEPHNQQLSRALSSHRATCPDLSVDRNGQTYHQFFCFSAKSFMEADGTLGVRFVPADISHAPCPDGAEFRTRYRLTEDGLDISIGGSGAVFTLPVVCSGAEAEVTGHTALLRRGSLLLTVTFSRPIASAQRIFCLSPGLEALELKCPIVGDLQVSVRCTEENH